MSLITWYENLSVQVAEMDRQHQKLFDRYNYPGKGKQKKMSKIFMDKVAEFKQQNEAGGFGLSTPVINFLSDWLKNHIRSKTGNTGLFSTARG